MKIEFANEPKVLIMKIDGEIDHRYATRIRREADRKIVTYPDKPFLIDLTNVSFMDSSGIGVIIGEVGNTFSIHRDGRTNQITAVQLGSRL